MAENKRTIGRGVEQTGQDPLRKLLAIETNPKTVHFVQSLPGRVLLFVIFAMLLRLAHYDWFQIPVITLGAAACAFSARYRNYALLLTTLAVLGLKPAWFDTIGTTRLVIAQEGLTNVVSYDAVNAGALAAFFLVSILFINFVRSHPEAYASRRPVVTLLLGIAVLTSLANLPFFNGLPLVALWSFITVICGYIWFLAYALVDQRVAARSPLPFQLGTFHAFWGSSTAPLGKGAAYLRKFQAKTDEELSITHLKALKLLLWSLGISFVRVLLAKVAYRWLHIVPLEEIQATHAAGHGINVLAGWESLIWAATEHTLGLAIWGHRYVACARLAGFRIQRNTWRLLEARSLADFWNRYYFYFKELLVEFFFYPTFLRFFKKHPRTRLFFATFVAAGVGNAIFHFVRDIGLLFTMGPWKALVSYQSYFFYCAVLALGIGISQLRSGQLESIPNTLPRRIWSFVTIWFFIICLHVFGDESHVYSLGQRLAFITGLFGINL